MGGFHLPELIIVLVIALLVFGPKKLPEMGSAIGKSIKEFRKGVNEITTAPKEGDLSAPKGVIEEARPITQEELNKLANGSYTSTSNAEVSALHKND